MVQKMQTYDKMSTIKGHPWVPQESQVYVSRSPNVERNNNGNCYVMLNKILCSSQGAPGPPGSPGSEGRDGDKVKW